MTIDQFLTRLKQVDANGLGAPALLLIILAMVVLPLPSFLLDVFFTFNIIISLIVLLVCIYSEKPLDFLAFPTVILLATLLRLALNVASTRVVLLRGHEGEDAAGQVIRAFGEVVIGGEFAVGMVVFAILVIINFLVVTKGAGRVSEVSARFTLDAMPGKQMAIDADLNAGAISQEEAKGRREEIVKEAGFYGAMDGASKFVRGDAIAGILILLINLIGGVVIGITSHNLSGGEAFRLYGLLTIGDGLVAQIPSLLLSTASGIIITRVSRDEEIGTQIMSQMFENPKIFYVTGGVLVVLGLIPGMPKVVFIGIGSLLAGVGYMMQQRQEQQAQAQVAQASKAPKTPAPAPEDKELGWDDVAQVDPLGLEVGYRLIPLVDKKQGGQLMNRIKGVRKKISQELGFLVPAVHIRDNLDLSPTAYRITLNGATVGEAEVFPDREMAINPGQVFGQLQGVETQDPAFGLAAVWIDLKQKEQAQAYGYTVVDPSTVVATHLSQVVQSHAYELIGHEEVQKMLDRLAVSAPKLVEDLIPNVLSLGAVVKVIQNLLHEQIPVRDVRTIVEALAEFGAKSQDPVALTAMVRISLSRIIVQNINGLEKELSVVTLDPKLEQLLQQSMQMSGDGAAGLEPGLAERLQTSITEASQRQEAAGQPPVLLVPGQLRPMLARMARNWVPGLHVLAYQEIPDTKQIRIVSAIGQ